MTTKVQQKQIRNNLIKDIIFYKITTSESKLVRFISARASIPSPIGLACSKLSIVGETVKSKPVYDKLNPKFQEEKAKFLKAGKFNKESFTVTTHSVSDMLSEIKEKLVLSQNQQGALKLITMRLNDKYISEM